MSKLFLSIGSIAMALAVMLGAFGAHALRERLTPEMLDIYETGVDYHFYHALGLLVVGIIAQFITGSNWLRWSGWMMITGILIFSGSLYILSITGIRWFGAVTPIGGTAFIVGWIFLAVAIVKGM